MEAEYRMPITDILDFLVPEDNGNAPTTLRPQLDAETGNVIGYEEQWDERAETAADAAHSMSLNRHVNICILFSMQRFV